VSASRESRLFDRAHRFGEAALHEPRSMRSTAGTAGMVVSVAWRCCSRDPNGVRTQVGGRVTSKLDQSLAQAGSICMNTHTDAGACGRSIVVAHGPWIIDSLPSQESANAYSNSVGKAKGRRFATWALWTRRPLDPIYNNPSRLPSDLRRQVPLAHDPC
jgi:hypothetical protein